MVSFVGTPMPKTGSRAAREPLRRPRAGPVLLVPALVTLVIGAWGLGTPSYWGDEAATLDGLPAQLAQRRTGRARRANGRAGQ